MSVARFMSGAVAAFALLPKLAFAQASPAIDVAQDGASYKIRVEATLSASPRHVWATLTDCARAPDFVPHLESCRIVERDPAGRWDIRENVANPPFLPRNKTIVRNEYAPTRSMSYKLVSGDMRVSEGAWTITPTGAGSKVTYLARVEPNMPVPGFLVVGAIKTDLPDMFAKLDSLSLALARQP